MIDIAIGTYIDNQAVIGYPVAFISRYWSSFVKRYWFASDDENAAVLDKVRPHGVMIEVVGQKIDAPADLMRAYPLCIDLLRKSGCASIALQEADLCFTDRGVEFVDKMLPEMHRMQIPAMQNKLFVETWNNPVGCVILPADGFYQVGPMSDWEVRLSPDHDFTEYRIQRAGPRRLMLDLGYISCAAFVRKMIGHQRLWPGDRRAGIVEAFGKSKAEGIRAALPLIQSEVMGKPNPVAYEGQYKTLIDEMGLIEGYREVCEVLA